MNENIPKENKRQTRYYSPWSLPWIIQRTILVIKEGRLARINWKTLLTDFRFTRQVRKATKVAVFPASSAQLLSMDETSLFGLKHEYKTGDIITCRDHDVQELSPVNRYFDHIYVVNLERRVDKRLEMIQKLTALCIRAEFFPAEDGYTPEHVAAFNAYFQAPIDENNAHEMEIKLKRKVIYSPGAWGTLLTYRKLLQDARSRGFNRILCLQDDAVFIKDFGDKFIKSVQGLPDNWKLLYLGASQHGWEKGKDLEFPSGEDIAGKNTGYYRPLNTDGAFAVGIASGAFSFLLEEIERMNCSFDSGALRSATRRFKGECFVLNPNLVIADVRNSDIRISRDQEDFAGTVRWELGQYDDPYQPDLVSIVVPAYNAVATIEKSIRSLLLQSYRNLEIIVVDDCSSDDTPAKVKKLSAEDARVRLISLPVNQGCYAARNAGLRASRGKYIAFQDADDISLPDRIALQITPLCLGLARFTLARIMRSGRPANDFDVGNPAQMVRLVMDDVATATKDGTKNEQQQKVGYVTSIYSRTLFEELGLFWENRFGADAEFVERVLHLKAGISIPGSMYAGNFLTMTESIHQLFFRIDKILMISLVQGEQNLTNQFREQQRLEFQKLFRKKLAGDPVYEYPGF